MQVKQYAVAFLCRLGVTTLTWENFRYYLGRGLGGDMLGRVAGPWDEGQSRCIVVDKQTETKNESIAL